MKILYISRKYDYGDPKRGFSYTHYNFYDSLLKMDGGRHKIIYFPFDEIMIQNGADLMNKMLSKKVLDEKPDLCFFCISTYEIKKETIKKIKAETLNWFCDDHWRFDNFSKHWAPCFNWVVTTDSKAIEKYHKLGIKNVIKSQWACNQFLYKSMALEKTYDIGFIGQLYGKRKTIIDKIKKAGLKINCWGKGWSNGRISQEEMIKIFSKTKINLNFSDSSTRPFLKAIGGIFLRPPNYYDNLKSFIDRRKRKQIKGRNFEIPGCGSFLLTDSADNLEDYYIDGKEIVIYNNSDDLIRKIHYYLDHKEDREKIAQAGYERTLKDHTYDKRFKKIFKTIGFSDFD